MTDRLRPRLRRFFAVALASTLAVLTFGACSDDRERTDAPATGDAAKTIEVADMTFEPERAEVRVGESVAWVWDDANTIHDVAFDGGPASPKQNKGTWQRRFDEPGTYPYVCTLHPLMKGTIVVR